MANNEVSQRYAEALIDTLESANADAVVEIRDELDAFVAAVNESSDLANVLHNPSVEAAERASVLKAVLERMQVQDVTSRFLRVLLDNGRMLEVDDIVEAFGQLADERAGSRRARISTARELSADELGRVRQALEKRTGLRLEVDVRVDPDLIGGVRAQVGSMVFDGTIRTELDRLRERLEAAG